MIKANKKPRALAMTDATILLAPFAVAFRAAEVEVVEALEQGILLLEGTGRKVSSQDCQVEMMKKFFQQGLRTMVAPLRYTS